MQKNKVIYTAIYGKKDNLYEPDYVCKDYDYICFTDEPDLYGRSKVWNIVYDESIKHEDPRMNAKLFKIMPHLYLKDYEYSVWCDANQVIHTNINSIMAQVNTTVPLVFFKNHHGVDNVYNEVKLHMVKYPQLLPSLLKQMSIYM
jgi:hypothetical protein